MSSASFCAPCGTDCRPDLSAHLGAELPLLVRGAYYDQFRPSAQPMEIRDLNAFLERIAADLADARPVDPRDALQAVLATLSRHIPRGQLDKVQQSLPRDVRDFWHSAEEAVVPPPQSERGRGEARPN